MEPISLSLPNLKSIIVRGQREQSKNNLLDILEFTTNLERGFCVRGKLRQRECEHDAFTEYVKSLNVQSGRRAKDLLLPPDWQTQGIYSWKVVDEQLVVKHRFRELEHIVSATNLKGWSPEVDLHIEYNYSELQAKLVLPSGRMPLQQARLARAPGRRGPGDGCAGGWPALEEAESACDHGCSCDPASAAGPHCEARVASATAAAAATPSAGQGPRRGGPARGPRQRGAPAQ